MNYLAIIAAAILNMVLGYLWYSPALFANAWMKSMGWDKKDMDAKMKKGMGPKYGIMFVLSLVSAFVLAWFIGALNVHTFAEGVQVGFLAWLGFTATAQISNGMFSSKNKGIYLIDTCYRLVAYLLLGGLLAIWR